MNVKLRGYAFTGDILTTLLKKDKRGSKAVVSLPQRVNF